MFFFVRFTPFFLDRRNDQRFLDKPRGCGMFFVRGPVSNSTVPHITIIIGASYGAGTYAMSGRAYNNRFTFIWPTAKIAVMGPKQIAGVMSMVRRGAALRKGEKFDEDEDAMIVKAVEEIQEKGSLALAATGLISDDGIIDPRDTRTVLGFCLSVVRNKAIEGAKSYGVFRL